MPGQHHRTTRDPKAPSFRFCHTHLPALRDLKRQDVKFDTFSMFTAVETRAYQDTYFAATYLTCPVSTTERPATQRRRRFDFVRHTCQRCVILKGKTSNLTPLVGSLRLKHGLIRTHILRPHI